MLRVCVTEFFHSSIHNITPPKIVQCIKLKQEGVVLIVHFCSPSTIAIDADAETSSSYFFL